MELFHDFFEGLTLGWLVFYLISTTISLLWYWSVCSFAQKEMTKAGLFIMIIVIPGYIMIPLIIVALYAAYLCPEENYWTNYKYYNVAAAFGREHANNLFGERSIFPSKKIVDKLKQLNQS